MVGQEAVAQAATRAIQIRYCEENFLCEDRDTKEQESREAEKSASLKTLCRTKIVGSPVQAVPPLGRPLDQVTFRGLFQPVVL